MLQQQVESSKQWREQDGIIYFSVTSDGTTGLDWSYQLESKGLRVGNCTNQVLYSPDFKPTSGVTTEVAVLKGMLFENKDRITKNIRAFATERELTVPNAEVACLIRQDFSDEEIEQMGLRCIIAMHEPIGDRDCRPSLLSAHREYHGCWLDVRSGEPNMKWGCMNGFAFAVSQK